MILVYVTGVKGGKPKNTPMLFPPPVSILSFIFKITSRDQIISNLSGTVIRLNPGIYIHFLIGLNLKPVKAPVHVIPAPHGGWLCQF